ncbi:MAG: hypothetical protein U0234_19805 [Sandaracinus sp.]
MGHWTALWVDHHEAIALGLEVEGLGHARIAHVRGHDEHTHSKKAGGHRHPADERYLAELTKLVEQSEHVVLTGPGHAKDELLHHIETKHAGLRARIDAVETLDRKTENELAAHAREIFVKVGRMHGIHVASARH